MKHSPLLQGAVRPRPPLKRSQAHSGIQPLSPLTHRTQRFQALPEPLGEPPYHYDLETSIPGISKKTEGIGKLVFHVVGDTGGIKHPEYQRGVAAAMKSDLNQVDEDRPRFFYHLGDVIYYNGEVDKYYDQFYEPYDHYAAPIIAIPGNHDGDPADSSQTSLDGWVRYFMTSVPHVDPVSQDAPRVTMSLPNVYFTLESPFVTIVGLYTNVPEHGSIDSVQQQWLTNEFATAPKDKTLIVALHHPIYSFDDHHGGSPAMADVVQHAINDSRRVPNLVLSAHVHNYQRIEREIIPGGTTPIIVAGHGGYYHLHNLSRGVENGTVDDNTGAKLVASDDSNHGYLTLSVDKKTIVGSMTVFDKTTEKAEPNADRFEYPAEALFLANGAIISL
jgi:calcineurin-like phosphoesterase family protein